MNDTSPKRDPRRKLGALTDTGVIDGLYKAVQAYVEHHGGKIVVIGGVECQEWPADPQYTFRIAVRCTGKPPAYLNPPMPKIKREPKGNKRAAAE